MSVRIMCGHDFYAMMHFSPEIKQLSTGDLGLCIKDLIIYY